MRPILKRVVTSAGMLLGGRWSSRAEPGYMAIAARAGVAELGVPVLIRPSPSSSGDVVKFQSWQTIIPQFRRWMNRCALPAGAARHPGAYDLASTVLGIAVRHRGGVPSQAWLDLAQEAPGAALFM